MSWYTETTKTLIDHVGRLYPVELCRKMPLMVLHSECESFSVCSPMLICCLLMVTFGPCRAKPLDARAKKWWCLVMLHALVHPAAGKLVQPSGRWVCRHCAAARRPLQVGWVEDVEDVFLFLEQWSIVQDVHLWMLFTIEELKSNTMCNVVM